MGLTKEQRYNKRLNDVFNPEIKRLKKCESIARNILTELNKKTEIDPCGLEEHHLINLIANEIRKEWYNIKESR